MNRLLAAMLVPVVDVFAFCVLFGNGVSLQSSQILSFSIAIALNCLLKVASKTAANTPVQPRALLEMLAVGILALSFHGGVLALLYLTWGWVYPLSITCAAFAAMAVAAPGCSLALSRAQADERARAWAIGLIIYSFALRLVYSGSVELLPEETYYWNYSQHLDIGYLDHPPMVAWLIKLGTLLFGQSAFGVRLGAVCCGLVTSIYTYRLTRNLFGDAAALAALLLAQVLPYFFCSGFLMTPDAPLCAAWAAALFYLERALLAGQADAWWRAGAALGIGMISKYSIGLLALVACVFMLRDRSARQWWRRRQPYAAALIALAIFSPVIIWNAEHQWASFAFQTSRRLAEAPRFALHKLIGSALILITPTGVLALAAAFASAIATDVEEDMRRRRFVRVAILVPLAVFAAFSLRHEVKLDWTGAPWVAALPIFGAAMAAGGATGFRAGLREAWRPTVLIVLVLFSAGLMYLSPGLPGVGYGKHIELVPVGWRELARQVTERAAESARETGRTPVLVGMDRYAIASELAYQGSLRNGSPLDTSSSHLFGGLGLMYERWMSAVSLEGRDLLLVAWSPGELQGTPIETHAERFGPIEDQLLMHNGQLVRHYYLRLAYNYRALEYSETPR